MPIIDVETRLSNEQAITASAKSTNILDLGAVVRDIGVGTPLYLVCQVTAAFTDAGDNSTVTPKVETDDVEAMSGPTVRQTLPTFAALSPVGTITITPLAPDVIIERFLQLDYVVANGDLTTGKITSYITPDPQVWRAYAKGYTGPTS